MPKPKIPKPYNGGEWTESRTRSFVMSALRRARWPAKYKATAKAYVKSGVNPATGRMCKLHKCSQCSNLVPQNQTAVDHIDPVVPIKGFKEKGWLGYNWDELLRRLYCEIDGLQVLCKPCHKLKCADERAERAAFKKQNKLK